MVTEADLPFKHEVEELGNRVEELLALKKKAEISDATIEALTSLLQKQPQGVLFIQDELIAWVKGMNQYRQGNGSDMEKWLS